MRLLLRFFAAALALAGLAAHAQATRPDCPPQAAAMTPEQVESGMKAAEDHGFLWRVSRDGHVSYLYGTIHLARLAWVFPGPTVVEAIRDSDTVALELDVLDAEIQRRLQLAMSSEGRPSQEPLPPALAQRVRQHADAECIPAEALSKMTPELQAASLTVLAARRDGLDPAYSIDLMLSGFAHGAHKTVVSLETPEDQMQALAVPDRDAAIAFVTDALDDLDAGRTRPMLNRLADVWAAGDHDQLARYTEWCECTHTPAERLVMKRLLDDRNPALAEKIDALHRSGRNVFAAVGSLHMVGPNGLPALLVARGYKVERGDFEAAPAPPKAQ
ncbi:MAG TPA: TraB/GumN family protein [Caldimonas sp.]|nr:TraB/GumN family protein [Caldimonas sp.]